VFKLSVKGVNGSGNTAIAAGDTIFYVTGDTPKLSAKATGVKYGTALDPSPAAPPPPSASVSTAQSEETNHMPELLETLETIQAAEASVQRLFTREDGTRRSAPLRAPQRPAPTSPARRGRAPGAGGPVRQPPRRRTGCRRR
jgi:hypothetical protein